MFDFIKNPITNKSHNVNSILGKAVLNKYVAQIGGHGNKYVTYLKRNDVIGNDNRYRIIKLIGEGSWGQVFKAKDRILKRYVIIKILHEPDSINSLDDIRHEARMIAAVKHDSILDIYDIEQSFYSPPFIVAEYINGSTLSHLIDIRHPWLSDENNIIWLGIELLRAVDSMHHSIHKTDAPYGYIHRDIKPDNIMIIQDNECSIKKPFRIKLIDLGITTPALPLHLSDIPATIANGTPLYMGPLALISSLDHRIDLWSIAIVLFECLTFNIPFTYNTIYDSHNVASLCNVQLPDFIKDIGLSTLDILEQFNHLPVELLSDISNKHLIKVIEKALNPDWNKGYNSACHFLTALEKIIDS